MVLAILRLVRIDDYLITICDWLNISGMIEDDKLILFGDYLLQ